MYNNDPWGYQQPQAFMDIFSFNEKLMLFIVLGSVIGVAVKFWMVRSVFGQFMSPFARRDEPMDLEHRREKNRHDRAKWGMVLAAVCIIGGLVLFFMGVTGETTVEAPHMKLEKAAPGTVFCVVGMMVVYFTRANSKD